MQLKPKTVNCYAVVFGTYKKDLKKIWIIINRILSKFEVRICSSLVINNHISTDPFAIAIHFNLNFGIVASELTENLPTNVTRYSDYCF